MAAGSIVKTGFGSLGSWFGYKQAPAQPQASQEESKESDHQVTID